MRIHVRVTPRAKRASLDTQSDGTIVVKVTAPADDGRANAAVIEALAEHFGVPKRRVVIVQGLRSRRKLVEISS